MHLTASMCVGLLYDEIMKKKQQLCNGREKKPIHCTSAKPKMKQQNKHTYNMIRIMIMLMLFGWMME